MTSTDAKGSDRTAAATPSTVENIQALRGIAALLVVWAHLKFVLIVLCPAVLLLPIVYTAHGAMGVDIFFIISGYVISMTACKRHHHPFDFFLARIARVSPLYLVAFVPGFLVKDAAHWRHLPFSSIWNGLFYLPIFDWGDYSEPPVGVGWTLSFEMWFYVAFALLLNLWKPRKVALFLPLFFTIGAGLMTFYHAGWYFPRFLFHPFVLEFAFGCVIYHTQTRVLGLMPWFLIAAGAICTFAFTQHTGFLGIHPILLSMRMDLAWLRVLLWGLPSALIVAGLVGLERNHGYILPRFLVWLGGISFSLYLTHRFSLAVVGKVGSWIHLHNPIVASVIAVLFSVFLAWLCWKWVEKPLTTRAQRWAKKRANPTKPAKQDSVGRKSAANVS